MKLVSFYFYFVSLDVGKLSIWKGEIEEINIKFSREKNAIVISAFKLIN